MKLQAGDKDNTNIWNECVALSMQDFERVYKLLDVHYDLQCGESFYNDRLPGVVDRLLKAGIAEISEDAVVVFFRHDPELADKPLIIRKRDGGFNYATTDVATIDYRVNELKADAIWYVVGAPQILHFKQIFAVARREDYTVDLRHITFGSVLGEDRKLMKTRSGENVPLRELVDEACRRARKIVDQKNPDLSEEEKNDIAEKIGIGAVKYADLSQYRTTDYIFSWEKMLSLHGNTAPYLQNAYVRIRSIFRKAGVATPLWGVEGAKHEQTGHRPVATGLKLSDPAELNLAETRLSVRGDRSPSVERVSSEHPCKLSVRVGEQLPCFLRGLPRIEIRGTGPQFASGVMRIDRASAATRFGPCSALRSQSGCKKTLNAQRRIPNAELVFNFGVGR